MLRASAAGTVQLWAGDIGGARSASQSVGSDESRVLDGGVKLNLQRKYSVVPVGVTSPLPSVGRN